MAIRFFSLLLFVLFGIQNLLAQREASIWYFGVEAGLDFNSGTPVPLLDGQLVTHEGCATISDRNGHLLFYTDGISVWDKNHRLMPNGSELLGHESSTQSAIVVPKAKSNDTQYYIFTVDDPDPEEPVNYGLNYSLVDLTLNNGFGDVVASEKNVHLITYDPEDEWENRLKCSEKLTAVQHNDESSIWVITHFTDSFYAFRVDENGVKSTPVISPTATDVPTGGYKQNGIGYLKVSPDGTKIGVAHSQTSFSSQSGPKTQNKQTGEVLLYDFDTTTGLVTNEISLLSNRIPYGVEFSQKSTKFYTTVNKYDDSGNPAGSSLFQYDLLANDIVGSKVEINYSSNVAGALQLAINGKIYRAGYPVNGAGSHISVINNPETRGVACNYQSNVISLGGQLSELGLPPFVQSFFILKFEYQNVCSGDTTEFTILDDAPFDSVQWDFGDGDSSTQEAPGHIYDQAGEYSVTLTRFINGKPLEPLTKQITIFDTPGVPADTVEYYQCAEENNPNGTGTFNLQLINPSVSLDDDQIINVFYYEDLASAEEDMDNTNSLPNKRISRQAGEVLIAKVYNPISACYSYASVSLNLKETVSVHGPILTGCDLENGLGKFNLEVERQALLNEFNFPPETQIRFYKDKNDALEGAENYLPNDYISPPTTLYLRIDQDNICYGLGEFPIQINDYGIVTEDEVLLCGTTGDSSVVLTSGVEEGTEGEHSYLWSSGETTPTINVNAPGEYTVIVTNNSNCSVERTIRVRQINPPEIQNVEVSNDIVKILTKENGSYEYALGHIDGPYQHSNIFTGVKTGTVTVYVRNKEDCGTASREISVIAYPRFFTPNGDQVNDHWKIEGLNQGFQPESPIFIFDRFGNLLKQLDPLSTGWDGTFQGRRLVSSDYWFRVLLTDGQELKGHFSLKR